MTRTTFLVLTTAALFLLVSAPEANAQRRINGAKQAKSLMGKLPQVTSIKASQIEEQLAVLTTDLSYMDEVEPVLIGALKSRHTRQREAAARLLRYTVSGAAVKPLAKAIRADRSETVRLAAVTSLCILKAEGAKTALRKASTSDHSRKVKAAAKATLAVIEDKDGARRAGCRRTLQKAMATLH